MQKWDAIRVYCDFLPTPHHKYSICVCPDRYWFFWVDSEPPESRKSRLVAAEIPSMWAGFLTHDSFVDTTRMRELPADLVNAAWDHIDGDGIHVHRLGKIIQPFKHAILASVRSHEVLKPDYLDAVLNGED